MHQRRPGPAAQAPVPAAATRDDVSGAEAENDAILRALLQDVRSLKAAATDVRAEVQEHNRLLDGLAEAMQQTRAGVTRSIKKLESVSQSYSGYKHMWLLVLLAFGVFVFIWLLLKRSGY